MTEKKMKTTNGIEDKSISSNENIEIIDEELDLKEEEDFNKPAVEKKSLSPKDKEQRDGFFSDTMNETIKLLINQTYLRNSNDKVSTKEIRETQFGQNISKTANYYFPDWDFEHPLWSLGFSAMSLIVLLNNKLPALKSEEQENEEEDDEDYRDVEVTDDDKAINPYLVKSKE